MIDLLISYNEHLNKVNQTLQRQIGQRDVLLQNQKESEKKEANVINLLGNISKAKLLLEMVVRSTEIRVKSYIEPFVTEALDFIFNQNLKFHIVFIDRRGQIEVDFIVLPSNKVEEDYQTYLNDVVTYEQEFDQLVKIYRNINYFYGGAVQEILGVVLRLVMIELLQIKGPVCLDEPTSSFHEQYAARVGVFIKSLSERFNRQIIYVTHSHALAAAANKVYEVKKDRGISRVEEI